MGSKARHIIVFCSLLAACGLVRAADALPLVDLSTETNRHVVVAAIIRRATAVPEKWNIDAQEKFAAQRFGIFIHWGLYANYAQGEWYQHSLGVGSAPTYGRMKDGFCPSQFDAAHDSQVGNQGLRIL